MSNNVGGELLIHHSSTHLVGFQARGGRTRQHRRLRRRLNNMSQSIQSQIHTLGQREGTTRQRRMGQGTRRRISNWWTDFEVIGIH